MPRRRQTSRPPSAATPAPTSRAPLLFDRYQGPPLDDNQVSLAYRLRFQPQDEPLADSALDEAMRDVTQGLEREVGGRVRSGA